MPEVATGGRTLRALRVLVALQLIALLALTVVTVGKFRVWADIDETPGAVTRLHVGALLAASLVIGALWVYFAGFFWFNDLGRTLGII